MKEINSLLEISSIIFIIIGILFFPLKNEIKIIKKKYNNIYLSNLFFFIGNIITIDFSLLNGYIPLLIQLIIFQFFTINGLKKWGKLSMNILNIHLINLVLILFPLFFLKNFLSENFKLHYNITILEIVAAFFAIIGSYFLNIKQNNKIAFLLFIFADFIYSIFFFEENFLLYSYLYMFFVIINSITFYKKLRNFENL